MKGKKINIVLIIAVVVLIVASIGAYVFVREVYNPFTPAGYVFNENLPSGISYTHPLQKLPQEKLYTFGPFGEFDDMNIKVNWHDNSIECASGDTGEFHSVYYYQIPEQNVTGVGDTRSAYVCGDLYYIFTFTSAEGPGLYGPFSRSD